MEKSEQTHKQVQNFYDNAASTPQQDLCCPTSYPVDETDHIPQNVLDRFYGCGSPMSLAQIKNGETVLDLGSGAGIDCFIASKKVGKGGKVIGIDMTDSMLQVANESKDHVSQNLGYDNVEFKQGFLEEIPVAEKSVDIVTSNCVINLSPDKRKVFTEISRILKDHGRFVVSDIVSNKDLTEGIRNDNQLWGECLGGALREDRFLSYLEQTGFYGIEILAKTYWKSISDIDFYSLTVRGYKLEKAPKCLFMGHTAVYNGPFKVIIDDEGHVFPRNQEVEICTDTLSKLLNSPYAGSFTIIEPSGSNISPLACCTPNGNSDCC